MIIHVTEVDTSESLMLLFARMDELEEHIKDAPRKVAAELRAELEELTLELLTWCDMVAKETLPS